MEAKKALSEQLGPLISECPSNTAAAPGGKSLLSKSIGLESHEQLAFLSLKNIPTLHLLSGRTKAPSAADGWPWTARSFPPSRSCSPGWTLPTGYAPFKKEQSDKIIPFFNRVLFFAGQKENAVHAMINLPGALKGKYVTGTRGKHSHGHIFLLELVLLQSSSARFHQEIAGSFIYPRASLSPTHKYIDITRQGGGGGCLSRMAYPCTADVKANANTEHSSSCICAYEYISCYYSPAMRFQVATREGRGKSSSIQLHFRMSTEGRQ